MTSSSNDGRAIRPGDRVRADDRSGLLFVVCYTGLTAAEWATGAAETIATAYRRPSGDTPRNDEWDDEIVVTVNDLGLELRYGDEIRDLDPWDVGERVRADRAADAPSLVAYPRSRLEPVD
ncbi:hypothetical protein [Natrinema sp. 74]|uniref:hypothetical protein n=1 Tax=Natrinema sp. 74 TaxID=3384159 RepID=UPI0038D4095A